MSKRPRSDGGSSSGPEDDPDDEPAASQDFPAGMGPGLEEEEDGEDLIGDDMGADYRALGAMDEYEADGLDEAEYGDMDARARADAEAILEARDRRERSSRMPQALLTSDDDEGGEERPARRRRRQRGEMADDGADADEAMFEEAFADDDVSGLNLEDYNVPLTEWISKDTVGDEIKRRFRQFLRTFQGRGAVAAGDNSNPVYANKVQQMCANNEESLEVSYLDMSHAVPILAIWVADCPREMLKLLDEAAMDSAPPRSCVHARSLFPHRTESFLLSGNSCANHVPRLRFNPSDRPCPYHRPANRGPHSRPAAGACRLPR